MIQRIQTVYLILAVACMGLLFLSAMSFMSVQAPGAAALQDPLLADGIFDVSDHSILLVLASVAMLLPALIIFLFKNRKLQMKLTRISIVLIVLVIALTIILFMQAFSSVPVGTEVTVEFGYLSPVLAIIFLVLALRFIKKDEKLVRSADRLR
ncbi:MAG: DUF4293 domain-containing protein [Saprospiraceae bacterium]|nr:DUF4293 domain-containing protein [Saprospiraceae bacterium]